MRCTPRRLRWSLGFLAHAAVVAECVAASRDVYIDSLGSQVGVVLAILLLPFTLAHAPRWRCFVEIDHDGIHQMMVGRSRFYAWSDVSDFKLRKVQRKNYVVFHENKDGRVRERTFGLTYGMKPELLVQFLGAKHLLLEAAADPALAAA